MLPNCMRTSIILWRCEQYSSDFISSCQHFVLNISSDILTAWCRSTSFSMRSGSSYRTALAVGVVLDLLHWFETQLLSFNVCDSSFPACMIHVGALDREEIIINFGKLIGLAVNFEI